MMSAERVANILARGLQRRRTKMVLTPLGKATLFVSGRMPRVTDKVEPMPMDSQMIRLKLWVKRLAVICGRVSNEMTSTIPIIRRHATMVRAMKNISTYSKNATGIRCERAYSLSKALFFARKLAYLTKKLYLCSGMVWKPARIINNLKTNSKKWNNPNR